MLMIDELPYVGAVLAASLFFMLIIHYLQRVYPYNRNTESCTSKRIPYIIDTTKLIFKYVIMLSASYVITLLIFELALWKTGAPRPTYAPTAVAKPVITAKKSFSSSSQMKVVDVDATKPRWIESCRSCLHNTDTPGPSVNAIYHLTDSDNRSDINIMPGRTIWINEHMAVGHVMYDIYILQLLKQVPITRIILQRAPCATDDLCFGLGTWESWYKGFYSAAIAALRPDIPVYLRWNAGNHDLHPIPLQTNIMSSSYNISQYPVINLHTSECFEYVYTRSCGTCFYNSVDKKTVTRFKAAAYALANSIYHPALNDTDATSTAPFPLLTSYFPHNSNARHHQDDPIIVTLSYRGGLATRQIANIDLLVSILQRKLPSSHYHIRTFISSNLSVHYHEQIALVASSHVVIAEHGAFQSNMIYMRDRAMFIELRGAYTTIEFQNYQMLAKTFNIDHKVVVTSGLVEHRLYAFYIEIKECERVAALVKDFAKKKSYMKNSS